MCFAEDVELQLLAVRLHGGCTVGCIWLWSLASFGNSPEADHPRLVQLQQVASSSAGAGACSALGRLWAVRSCILKKNNTLQVLGDAGALVSTW